MALPYLGASGGTTADCSKVLTIHRKTILFSCFVCFASLDIQICSNVISVDTLVPHMHDLCWVTSTIVYILCPYPCSYYKRGSASQLHSTGEGGLISEWFSLWLHYFKKCAKKLLNDTLTPHNGGEF